MEETDSMRTASSGDLQAVRSNLAEIRNRIEAACDRADRDPDGVRICAVTKTRPAEAIQALVDAGITLIGENRVQEAERKYRFLPDECDLHLIGHLQSNKTSLAVRLFDAVQSVDRPKIVDYLQRHCDKRDLEMPVFIQVNASEEESKFGAAPDQVGAILDELNDADDLFPKGFMTMAPYVDNPEDVRPIFERMRSLRDEHESRFEVDSDEPVHLSMGMTQDYPVAVEEGSTLVRIGRGLFENTSWK